MMLRLLHLLWLLTLAPSAPAAQPPKPCSAAAAAVVTHVTARCYVSGNPSAQLSVGTMLNAGDHVACNSTGRAHLRFCQSGEEKQLSSTIAQPYIVPHASRLGRDILKPAARSASAPRDTISLAAAGSSGRINGFMFPESLCENAQYQCLAVRPSDERVVSLTFAPNGWSILPPEARTQIDEVAQVLKARRGKLTAGEILVEGYADGPGSGEFVQQLSEQLAESVVRYLVAAHGVEPKALRAIGHGRDMSGGVPADDAQNTRRVDVRRAAN